MSKGERETVSESERVRETGRAPEGVKKRLRDWVRHRGRRRKEAGRETEREREKERYFVC